MRTETKDTPIGHMNSVITAIERDLANLTKRRQQIDAELKRLDGEARTIDESLKHLESARVSLSRVSTQHVAPESPVDVPLATALPEVPTSFAKRRMERPSSQAWQIRKHAYQVLKAQGHPLSRAEILEKFLALGFVVEHHSPAKHLGRILTDAQEFEYRENGYWIAGEPITSTYQRDKRFRSRKKREAAST